MNSFFTLQYGEITEASPNWFDWFSILISSLISIISIWGGFKIAKSIYSKEKNDKINEDIEIQNSEISLFKNSLLQLNKSCTNQIANLERYLEEQNFSLEFDQGIQIDFLQFIDIKNLYRNIGLSNSENINEINTLLSTLYKLNDFRPSLRDEFRTFMKKYSFHEAKFYSYRKLLYTKYFELCNQRSVDFKINEGVKMWKFHSDDKLMKEYFNLRRAIFNDTDVMTENGLKDRKLLNERFIVKLSTLSSEFIPEDYNAIELNDIANEVYSAYTDIEHISQAHFNAVI